MLNVTLLSAVVFDHQSWDTSSGTVDPAVVVTGELPARARPFVVDRVYRAPQGYYDESFALLDPDGEILYQHPYARLSLRGEMFEDRFRDVIRDRVEFTSADEHTMVFLVRNTEVGRVPVFVDAPESARAHGVLDDALASTLKKSTIVWLRIPQPDGDQVTRPAWFVYDDGKVFVLTGPDEQDLTNLPLADEVTLVARSKDVRSQLAAVPADVRVVDNDSEEFDRVAEMGVKSRLNLADFAEAASRWKRTCTLVELTPRP